MALRFDNTRFSKTKITDNGYLETTAVVTRSGVFLYKNADGTVRRELRHPDDVFKSDSLNTIKMMPITDGHPQKGLMNSKIAKELTMGHVGENIQVDGRFIKAPMTITVDDAIQKIKHGKNKLSLGYTADVIDEKGEYNGQKYDCRQKNIKYNHLAICDVARAGSEAAIMFDSGEDVAELITDDEKTDFLTKKKEDKKMPTLKLDGIDYEASQEVINSYQKVQKKLDEMEKNLEKKTGILDATEVEKERVQKKLDEMEKGLDEQIKKSVMERVELESKASRVFDEADFKNIDIKTMSNLDIKKAVINKISSNVKLDDMTESYIDGRFDTATEMYQAGKEKINEQRKTVNDTGFQPANAEISLQNSKDNYNKRLINGGKI